MRQFASSLALASLLVLGCEPGGPTSTGDGPLGRPDPMHGPPTDADIDGDGVPNESDICPSLANADQTTRCDYDPPPTGTTDGLERLNFWRAQLGLDAVVEDAALTAGCVAHLDYLQAYAAAHGGRPYLSHEEDLSLPYASPEGAMAGANSVLSYGTMSGSAAVDGWLDTLYHRLPLIHPGLTRVGVAFENGYACVEFRTGTDGSARAPHPILWPVADSIYTRDFFGGSESPCPTIADPLAGGDCPASAAIASLGLHGSTFADVEATITRLDTMEPLPLLAVYFDGGPSPHEQMGYLEGSIALVPEPGTMLARATYEVSVSATIDGAPTNVRWRYSVGAIDQTLACDLFGNQGSFARAIEVTAASINGRVCDMSDFYVVRGTATHDVTLQYDRRVGALELVVYDAAQNEVGRSAEHDGTEAVNGVAGGSYIEVRGAGGAMGGYILVIE
jgi:hypothetical protein